MEAENAGSVASRVEERTKQNCCILELLWLRGFHVEVVSPGCACRVILQRPCVNRGGWTPYPDPVEVILNILLPVAQPIFKVTL